MVPRGRYAEAIPLVKPEPSRLRRAKLVNRFEKRLPAPYVVVNVGRDVGNSLAKVLDYTDRIARTNDLALNLQRFNIEESVEEPAGIL